MTSFSRLGSANTYDTAVRNIANRQAALSNQIEKNTAGKRVLRASDDPTGAAQAERALTRISRIATDQRALESQRSSITQAESTLGDVSDALTNFRDLIVSAGSGVHTAADRKTIARQLTDLRDQIVNLANTKDANGQPLFSSLGSALTPFVGPQSTAPDYKFNGLPGQAASSEVSIPFSLDGDSAFMLQSARDGAYNVSMGGTNSTLQTDKVALITPPVAPLLVPGSSYKISNISVVAGATPGNSKAQYMVTETPEGTTTALAPVAYSSPEYLSTSKTIPITVPGLSLNLTGTPTASDTLTIDPSASVFSVLDDAINDIGGAVNNTAASQAVSQALANIDISMGRISAVRGQAGDLLNHADRIASSQDARAIQMEADRSNAEDMDAMQGISDVKKQETGYQVALQSYAQIQKLSLFNYLS